MYEIIATPQEYQIDHLINGTDNANIELTREERDKWAKQIVQFSDRLSGFAQKANLFSSLLASEEKIAANPASLKTLKNQLFLINDALNSALGIADMMENDMIKTPQDA
ncbi:hypothetical protein DO021_13200 [Desulfobacter hydrogenophilus]|uniref:Uncharacterized protein n=1 Tax=Desulfobacter hydrogenophilus TaxID=2291 RepID=A0A328FEW8_9BACT|nr:hypothetical protein [Desulfobacter hydrogenophilus]NDY72531.1 hypothetical protein [Desulfobacter hydrogenophilus]QBH14138.1 hypothetical protein EYB58_15185 [Desulfobacter hydrogenophilus]RAM01573.1 hypothetical protein DO021_13200 [Desulfobacter hydrogenophilus]